MLFFLKTGNQMNITTFLAKKYLQNDNKNNFIFIITRLTFVGIFVASLSMTLILMFTSGFDSAIKANLQGLSSDGMIIKNENDFDDHFFHQLGANKKKLGLSEFCQTSFSQVILQQSNRYSTLLFNGVDPHTFGLVTNIEAKLISKIHQDFKLEEMFAHKLVIIGNKLANKLNATAGQSITIFVPKLKNSKITLKKKEITIGAIMKVGFDDYDQNLIIGSKELFSELFETKETDIILVKVDRNQSNKGFVKKILKIINQNLSWLLPTDKLDPVYTSISGLKKAFPKKQILHWKEISPMLLASMKLEQIIILFIVCLILFVSVVNMMSLLFMKVQSKKKEIALLMILGLSHSQIRALFLKVGMIISLTASLSGETLAWIIGFIIQKYNLITLPDIYLVQKLPVNLNIEIFILVFAFINLVVYLACKIPTRSLANMNLSLILRH